MLKNDLLLTSGGIEASSPQARRKAGRGLLLKARTTAAHRNMVHRTKTFTIKI